MAVYSSAYHTAPPFMLSQALSRRTVWLALGLVHNVIRQSGDPADASARRVLTCPEVNESL